MEKVTRRIAFTVVLTALAVSSANGQALDQSAIYKKSREEFQQAERVHERKQTTAETVQQELEDLGAQRVLLQKEATYARSKVAQAESRLAEAAGSGDPDQVIRWERELAVWQVRLEKAQADLQEIEAETQAGITALQQSLRDSYANDLILVGESLEVIVLEDDTLNGVYQVRRGGYLLMPRVGRIYVAGKDLEGAERAIKNALEDGQIRDGTVMVERPLGAMAGDGPVIYLTGEFRNPGPWRIPSGVSPTAVTTILRSGGLTPSADLTQVRILRLVSGQPLVEEIDVQAILDGVGLTSDLSLIPGDIVMIPSLANIVYVTGNVTKPGNLRLMPDEDLTVMSAILRSGGFARFANRNKVYILRDRGDGAKQRIPVNIKDVQGGKTHDVILEPKDIIVVPERFFSF